MAVSHYLNGKRTPDAETIKRLNREAENLTQFPDVAKYLDTEAMLAGLLDPYTFDVEWLVDRACQTLSDLGEGLLIPEWRERMHDEVQHWDDPRLAKLIVALNHACFKALYRAMGGSIPAESGYDALRAVLKKHGLTNLIATPSAATTAMEKLTNAVHVALKGKLDPALSAGERWQVEQRVLLAAAVYGVKISSPTRGLEETLRLQALASPKGRNS